MMKMKLLAFVTPLSIYHGSFTWKPFWDENFTCEERFTLGELTVVNMKNCFRRNVNKHREIKDNEKYITLDILLKFRSLEKMIITSSEPTDNLGRSGNGLITYLGLRAK